jgi:hypothetical protein
MERTSSSSARHRIASPPTQGTPGPPTRRQHRRGRYPHQGNHTVARNDVRIVPPVVPTRHQRHPHSTPLHTLRCEYHGRYTQPRARLRLLATQPSTRRPPSSPVGPPFYRPLHLYAQHVAITLQRHMARPLVRGRRLPTPLRDGMAPRKQLMQPSLDCWPNPRCQTTCQAQPLPSWPPTGPTKRGTKTSSDLHPAPYISRQGETCSSPAGLASPRGSDHPRGAS